MEIDKANNRATKENISRGGGGGGGEAGSPGLSPRSATVIKYLRE